MAPDTGMIYRLEDYRPSDYLIDQTSLVFHLEATATRVIAVLDIHRRAGAPLDAPLVLDGDGLKLVRLELDGRPVDASAHEATPERLTLRLKSLR